MWDIIQILDVTVIGFTGVAALGSWAAYEFYRNHRVFKARERLYLSISERMQRGEQVDADDYRELIPEDRAALQALQQSKKTLSESRPRYTPPRNQEQGEDVAHAFSPPLEGRAVAVEHRG